MLAGLEPLLNQPWEESALPATTGLSHTVDGLYDLADERLAVLVGLLVSREPEPVPENTVEASSSSAATLDAESETGAEASPSSDSLSHSAA